LDLAKPEQLDDLSTPHLVYGKRLFEEPARDSHIAAIVGELPQIEVGCPDRSRNAQLFREREGLVQPDLRVCISPLVDRQAPCTNERK
jgi:hypothetical protein